MSRNGIVWKNDVNAHGAMFEPDRPFLIRRKICSVCNRDISDFETVLYAFVSRGTAAATSAYCHKECESKFTIPTADNKRTQCYICGDNRQLDRAFRVNYQRHLRYHSSCLAKASRVEVVSEETLKLCVRKRMINRLKKKHHWKTDGEPPWYASRMKLLVVHGRQGEVWTKLIEALKKPAPDEEWLQYYRELETI